MSERSPRPPAPSALGVSHPLDGLLHPTPCKALRNRLSCESPSVPAALLGFPDTFRSAGSFEPARAGKPRVSSLRPSPPPRRTRSLVPSLPALRREASCRPLPGNDPPSGPTALRGLDRRRVGVSSSSEPLAPTVLRFLANLHTRECEPSTRPPGLPRRLPKSITAPPPTTSENFRDPAPFDPIGSQTEKRLLAIIHFAHTTHCPNHSGTL